MAKYESNKIAGWNCIFPPLGIWWKTIESRSHLDQKFMNFNVKSPNVCHFCFKLIVLHDTLSVIWSFYLEMIQERCHLKAKTLIFINMKKINMCIQYWAHKSNLKMDYLFYTHCIKMQIAPKVIGQSRRLS